MVAKLLFYHSSQKIRESIVKARYKLQFDMNGLVLITITATRYDLTKKRFTSVTIDHPGRSVEFNTEPSKLFSICSFSDSEGLDRSHDRKNLFLAK